MTKNKKKEDLSSKNFDELSKELNNNKKDLFGIRYNLAIKELKDTSLLKKRKKNIARIMTLMSNKIRGKVND
jgi:large subunit ribosomal protein L29